MPVLVGGRGQELVDLVITAFRHLQIFDSPDLGANQVVAVHRGRHRRFAAAGGHELENRHLRSGILHRHSVGAQIGRGRTTLRQALALVLPVREQNFLGKRERPADPSTHRSQFRWEFLVVRADHGQRVSRMLFHCCSQKVVKRMEPAEGLEPPTA
jgi:hypothetical protein